MELRRALVFVKDFDRMLAFYRDGLGLSVVKPPDAGWVELEGVALHAIPEQIAATITIAQPPAPRAQTPIKLVFHTRDLAADRAHLVKLGAQMFEPTKWGSCDGVDPEGNVFQLVS